MTDKPANPDAEKLLPCPVPWCDDPQPQVHVRLGGAFFVRCDECQTQAPRSFSRAEAIAAWNTRPLPTSGETLNETPCLVEGEPEDSTSDEGSTSLQPQEQPEQDQRLYGKALFAAIDAYLLRRDLRQLVFTRRDDGGYEAQEVPTSITDTDGVEAK